MLRAGSGRKRSRESRRASTPNPKDIGERSQVRVMAALILAGEHVLVPAFSDNRRYDLVIDKGDRFLRVQVKTGRLFADGAVRFATSSSQYHRGGKRRCYRGQCDYFAVYCPGNDQIYYVPVSDVGTSEISLRVRPSQNCQRKRVRWARDCERMP
jgi:hypothetical protein